MKKGFWYRVSLRVAPILYAVISRLLFATYRVTHHGLHHLKGSGRNPGPIVQICWHYSVLYCIHRLRKKSVLMLSASDDAEYLDNVLKKTGHAVFRGSQGKGGLTALRKMAAIMAQGQSSGIVADGSKGPPRILQAGCVLLSSWSGASIVPVAWSADRYITFKSWDRTVLPLPFARVSFWCGEPYQVPGKLRAPDVEQHRLAVERRLNDLYVRAWKEFGKESH